MDNKEQRQLIIGFSVGLLAMVASAVFVFAVLTLRHQYREKKKAESRRDQRRRRGRTRQYGRDADMSGRDEYEVDSPRSPAAVHLAYNGRSFNRQASMDSGSGPMFESYNARPLHPVNEPFYDRQTRVDQGASSALSVVPSSRSSPAVVPFRQCRLPNSTAHFSYDGHISHEAGDQARVKARKESSSSSSKQVRSQHVSTSSSTAPGSDAIELQRRRSSDLVSTTTTSTSIYRKNIWEGQKERLYRWRITDETTSATSLPRPSVSTSHSSRYMSDAASERNNNFLWPDRRNSPSSLVGYLPDNFKNFLHVSDDEDEEEEEDTSRSSSESSDRFHRPNVPSFVDAEFHSSVSTPYSLPDSGYYDDVFHRPDSVRV